MFSSLRDRYEGFHERFGTAGLVVAVIALIAALTGTAIAAGGLTAQQEKQVKKIAKKYAGKPGAPGAAGPAGPQGPAGANGAQGPKGDTGSQGPQGDTGDTGAAGAAGKSVVTGTPSGSECEGLGGATVQVEGQLATKKTICNGEDGTDGATGPTGPAGSPWVAGTAPSDVILKGTWAVQQYTAAAAGEEIFVPISTGVPVPNGSILAFATGAGLELPTETQELADLFCPGSAVNPTVDTAAADTFATGVVCAYASSQTNLVPPVEPSAGGGGWELGESGGGLMGLFDSKAAGVAKGYGSWVMYTP